MSEMLGREVVDMVTGFTGVATGFARYLTGCDQYFVLPKTEDAKKYPEGQWLDVNRLNATDAAQIAVPTEVDKGCDIGAPRY